LEIGDRPLVLPSAAKDGKAAPHPVEVRKHWAAELARVEREIAEMTRYRAAADVSSLKSKSTAKLEPTHVGYDAEKMRELQARLEVLKTTDMALIVSPAQNEIQQMQAHGLDIVPHRKRMNDSPPPLDEKFKDSEDPLRIVFLCATWLTGSDAPSCSTVYPDKPMRNHTQPRADFAEKYESLIESYNAGSWNIEELFEELVKLNRTLSEEQQRHVRENMTEEELVIFDILTRPAPELSQDERAEVKKVARELLNRLKLLLVLNWRQKSSARSQLKLAIEDLLDTGLPRAYTPELYQQKCAAVFEHVYESYPERDAGVYAAAG
jgi:type I site-specific restriction-modification system R (restriction) subunit